MKLVESIVLALCTALFLFMIASIARADGWAIDKMNAQIEDTNVIVGGVCSGTIISKEQRLILTAYHCVNDLFQEVTEKFVDPKTNEIKEIIKRRILPLKITTNKVRNYEIIATDDHTAKIVGSNSDADIALIQVIDTDYTPLAAAKLAPESYAYRRGLKIYVVGNPAITFDNSINEGIISSPQRTLELEDRRLKVFQVSAAVIGGNSGGSVLNDNGEIIGTLSAGVRGAAISFAVPISYTKEMIIKSGFGGIMTKEKEANH